MIDLAAACLYALALIASAGTWAWSLRFSLAAVTGQVLEWRVAVLVTLLLFAVSKQATGNYEDESLSEVFVRLAPFGVVKPLLIAAAAWVMS